MIYETYLRDLFRNWMPMLSDFTSTPVTDISELSLQLLGEAIDYCSFCDGAVFTADPFHEPPEYYDTEISSCIVEDGHVEGMLLIRREDARSIMPVLLFATGDDMRESVRKLTAYSLVRALRSYPPYTIVVIPSMDDIVMERLKLLYGRQDMKLITSFFDAKQTDL